MTERFSTLRFATAALAGARGGAGVIARAWRKVARHEGVVATATFAVIFASAISGLDAVFTGNAPDWNDGGVAYAIEAPLHPGASEPVVRAQPLSLAPLAPSAAAPIDYSFTTEELLGGPDDAFAPAQVAAKPAPEDFAASVSATIGKAQASGRL